MKILAIIPAYDAEESLAEVIDGLFEYGFKSRDILVVDDGSSDRTSEIAHAKGVSVISHPANKGKGAALKTGFKYAIDEDYDAVLTLDADMQHPPEYALKFIETATETGADVVIGNRLDDLSTMPFHRRFSNLTTTFFVRVWTGKRIGDSQCGYRFIKTDILKKINLRTNYYQTETEFILEAARNGAEFASVPVPTIYNDFDSKMNPLIETFRFIGVMLAHPFRRRNG